MSDVLAATTSSLQGNAGHVTDRYCQSFVYITLQTLIKYRSDGDVDWFIFVLLRITIHKYLL